ncbi:radical SAM protein [Solwaraspora sp. WMMB335]|uniref:radical SAM protein n=1 Tax=Solwaraspora sp. WMMB335 TaxID=3404118 RepID=UPI003B956A16
MTRVYGVDGHLVHDPVTGTTHLAPDPLPAGRRKADPTQVRNWPVITPDQIKRSQPTSICWTPIVRCDLRCPHCLDDTTLREPDSTHRQRIADILAASGVLGVDISGGEPLLLTDLPRLADTITAGGRAAVSVTTNGTHLARRVDELTGVVDAVRVSLDGAAPATHDRLRGPGSFTAARAGIHAALDSGIPVQIQTVLMADNRHEAQRLIDLAHDLGVTGVTFLQMLPTGAGLRLQDQMLTDVAALDLTTWLRIPDTLHVHLRTRELTGSATTIRADGRIWRYDRHALSITAHQSLAAPDDLTTAATTRPRREPPE